MNGEQKNIFLVSVIIPVFNTEHYLEACIDSVILQTYQNLEIILVDDGSTDNSAALCDGYKSIDDRIVVIHKENGGLSFARNVGLEIANGEYICFVDSDDYISPNYIERMIESIGNSDLCICNFISINEDGTPGKKYGEKLVTGTFFKNDYNSLFISKQNVSCVVAWNKLYKKELFATLRFPLHKIHEDEWVAHRIIYSCQSITTIDDELYYYVQRENSITHKRIDSSHIFDLFYGFKDRYSFAKLANNSDLKKSAWLSMINVLQSIIQNYDFRSYSKHFYKEIFFLFGKYLFDLKHFLMKTKLFVHYLDNYLRYISVNKKIKKIALLNRKNRKHFVMLGTPVHGNLGDHAIVCAEKKMLKALTKNDFKIIEFQTREFFIYKEFVYKCLGKSSIVIIDGGGNIGSLWKNENDRIIDILENTKRSKIIMFPETVYYNDSDFKSLFLTRDKSVFKNANCLYFLRDQYSYDFFEKNIKQTHHFLVPDIVYSLKSPYRKNKKTKICGLIFRNDKEKNINDELFNAIKCFFQTNGYTIVEMTTVINKNVRSKKRQANINHLFKQLSRCELIITDRLHGMIFSFVNNTKCVAINNVNKKVEGSYFWIKNNPHYMIINNFEEGKLTNFLQFESKFDNPLVDFTILKKEIKKWIKD